MHIRNLLFAVILALFSTCTSSAIHPLEKPNIIIILIDDAGYIDFGFMGSEDLDTPEIDKLAKSGVVFTDAHVSATVCAPSRAGLLTGKYQQRFGFEANGTGPGDIGLSDNVSTLAEELKEDGYSTVALGKWHLGSTESDIPNNRGFDDFYGFLGGSRSYFPINNPSKNTMLQHNGKRIKFVGYLTDVLGEYSVQYIEEHKNNPFFMYLAYNAVHAPMHAKKEHLEKYKNHPRKELAAMTWSLDENIGKLRNKLKELNILDNTLIYFLSDNGGSFVNTSDMGPLKGWKGNKFEGGHRVPFVISWPNKISGNKRYNGLTSSLDIYTTSIHAANISKKKSQILDGVNLLPFLKNEQLGQPHDTLFWRKLDKAAARIGDNKIIRIKDFGSRMYNLKNDLGEINDISVSDSINFNKINKALELWETKMTTPLWKESKAWMDVNYHIHKQLLQNKPVKHKYPPKNIEERKNIRDL